MRKLDKLIQGLGLEGPIAKLPKPLRFAIARKRYGWIDGLEAMRHAGDGPRSLRRAEELGAIFVHIPKAAGISVAESLFGNHAGSHTPLHMYLALYGAKRFDEMFKFAFVRHPADRLVSAYTFLVNGGMTDTDAAFARQHLTDFADINDFVLNGLDRPAIRKWQHFRPQSQYLIDPRTGKIGVDFVGKFESLGSDFDVVAQRLGLDARITHANKTNTKKPALSEQALAKIWQHYSQDFGLLGYQPVQA